MSDNNSEIRLSRRRILAGLGTIGIASAATGAGTMALLSDEESSTGNVVKAGTLDLTVADKNPLQASITIDDIKPGESHGPYPIPLANTGTIDGYLDFALIGFNHEGLNPESETDTEGAGDLGDVLEVTFEIGGHSVSGTFNELFNSVYDVGIPLAAGDTKDAKVSWHLPSSAGNDIQGDTITADLIAFLHQTQSQSFGRTFDVVPVKDTPGSGTVRVVSNLVYIDTSTFNDPASQWTGSENIGFWFGDGSDSTGVGNGSGKVEVKWSPNSGWHIPNNDSAIGAALSDFSVNRDGDVFTVAFDDSTYSEFGLYIEPENSGGAQQAVATPDDAKPWTTDLYDL